MKMRGMVVSSNNEFTNHLFKRLGGPEGVQWMLKKQAPQIFRNIQIVENIPAQGRTYAIVPPSLTMTVSSAPCGRTSYPVHSS